MPIKKSTIIKYMNFQYSIIYTISIIYITKDTRVTFNQDKIYNIDYNQELISLTHALSHHSLHTPPAGPADPAERA